MFAKTYRTRLALVVITTLGAWSTVAAQSAPDACSLLTDAEAARLVTRGRPIYGQIAEAISVVGGAGSICEYPGAIGQVGFFPGPESQEHLETFLKAFKRDKEVRHPVSGVGDLAWIMFPTPRSKYEDRVAYLVAAVGPHTVTAALLAYKGNAESWMGNVCRGDQSRDDQFTAQRKEDCKKVLADQSETAESLQPAVVELAKVVVAKVRSGKNAP